VKKNNRYQQLDALFKYKDGYTLIEILARLDQDISKRTFHDDIKTLQGEPYNVKFANNLYRGKERLYRYEDISFSLFPHPEEEEQLSRRFLACLEALPDNPQHEWMKFFFVEMSHGMLDDGRSVVSFDSNKLLEGFEYFTPLAEAIVHKQPLKIRYKPFDTEMLEVKVHPYHLRQFNNRWFLFGLRQDTNYISVFSLDRIREITNLCIEYQDSDIDFEEYFDDIVGVTVTRGKVETISLRINAQRYGYIKTKPLHHSQTELHALATDSHRVVSIKTKINAELITLLLSFGPDVEVLSPESLRETMRQRIALQFEQYNR